MPEQPVNSQDEQVPSKPEPEVTQESKRTLPQRIKSRLPYTKEFENWLKQYQERVSEQRLNKGVFLSGRRSRHGPTRGAGIVPPIHCPNVAAQIARS